jgi:hypothetical protein
MLLLQKERIAGIPVLKDGDSASRNQMKPAEIANLLAIREFILTRIGMSFKPSDEETEILRKLKEVQKLLDAKILKEVTSEKFIKSL